MRKTSQGLTFLAAALMVLFGLPCMAGQTICATIEGSLQGPIAGDPPQALVILCTEQIGVFELHHLVDADAAGRLAHRTLIFTKRIDSASVNLWRAWENREPLTTVQFQFFRGAVLTHYYTIQLGAAFVESIEPYVGDGFDPELSPLQPSERIRLSYTQLTVTFVGGHTGSPSASRLLA